MRARFCVGVLALCGVLAMCGVLGAGCGGTRTVSVYRDGFEELCEGVPCGWTQIAGPEGAAVSSESLPGERGIMLVGDGVAIRGEAREPFDFVVTAQQLAVVMAARCDAGASIDVRVVVEELGMGDTTWGDAVTPPPEWTAPTIATLTRDPLDSSGFVSVQQVLGVLLQKNGPGACEIDELRVDAIQFFF